MSSKTLWYTIGILILLLFIWIGVILFNSVPYTKVAGIDVSNITEENIDRITITYKDNRVVLVYEDTAWKVSGYSVDPVLLENIWGTFKYASITGPVSKNPNNHTKFEVDKENSVVLEFAGENETYTLMVGKSATARKSSYVRQADTDEVYVFNADLRFLFPTFVDSWRDTTALSLTKDTLQYISVEKQDGVTFTLLPTEDAWVARLGDKDIHVPETRIDTLFAQLNPLRTDAFIEDETDIVAFEKTLKDLRIVMVYKGDHTITLELEKQNSGLWWMRVNEEGTIYEIPEYRIDNMVNLTDIIEE